MKKCVLTIANPDNDNNWANFESGKLHFHVNNTAPEVVIDISNPDEYKDKLEIPAEKFPADMTPYVKGTKAYWKLEGKARRATTKELKLKAEMEYDVAVGAE